MGFPLLQKPTEMCLDRQVGVTWKFWRFNRDHMCDEETNTIFKCIVHGFHAFHSDSTSETWIKWCTVTNNTSNVVTQETKHLRKISWCECSCVRSDWPEPVWDVMMWQIRILFPFHFVVFKQTMWTGQLSEDNLTPDSLTDMVSIMVDKVSYKP